MQEVILILVRCWRVYVDGQEVEIYRADYLFRAVPLEQGQHVVEFRYRPLFQPIGLVLALVVLTVLCGMGVARILGRRSEKRLR